MLWAGRDYPLGVPVSSGAIGQIFSQQQAQFGNAASYSEQVAQQYGLSQGKPVPTYSPGEFVDPRTPPPPPDPSLGTRMGMGLVGGGLAAGSAMGLLGSLYAYGGKSIGNFGDPIVSRGLLDPFLTSGRAATQGFWGGSGLTRGMLGGQRGLFATISAAGGLMGSPGGFGAVARGVAGAVGAGALAFAPYLALGAGLDFAGGHLMAGAQQYGDMQGILTGATRGQMPLLSGQFGPGATGSMSSMVRQMAGQDPYASVADLQGLMGGMIAGGHMRNVGSLDQFKTKFREMTQLVKEVAQVFHTSLQDALPILEQHKALGFSTPAQIRQGLQALQSAGIGGGLSTQETLGIAAQGTQISQMFGGRRAVGALTAAGAASMLGTAEMTGTLAPGQLAELGGRTAVAGRMTAQAFRLSRGRFGRRLIGAMIDPETGDLDPEMVARFRSGEMGRGDMRREFRERMSSRSARAALRNRLGDLSTELVQQVGAGEFMGGMANLVLGGREDQDEDVRSMQLQRVLGVGRREAELYETLARQGGPLHQASRQQVGRVLESHRTQMAVSQRKLGAIVDRVSQQVFGPMGRALEELSQSVVQMTDEMGEEVLDAITGTSRTTITQSGARGIRDMMRGRSSFRVGARPLLSQGGRLSDRGAAFFFQRGTAQEWPTLSLIGRLGGAEANMGRHQFEGFLSGARGVGLTRQQAIEMAGATPTSAGVTPELQAAYSRASEAVGAPTGGSAAAELLDYTRSVAREAGGELESFLTGGTRAQTMERGLVLWRGAGRPGTGDTRHGPARAKEWDLLQGLSAGGRITPTQESLERAAYLISSRRGARNTALEDFLASRDERMSEARDKLVEVMDDPRRLRNLRRRLPGLKKGGLFEELGLEGGSDHLEEGLRELIKRGPRDIRSAEWQVLRRERHKGLDKLIEQAQGFLGTGEMSDLGLPEGAEAVLTASVSGADMFGDASDVARRMMDAGASPAQMGALARSTGGDYLRSVGAAGVARSESAAAIKRAGRRGGRRGFMGQMRHLMGGDFVKKNRGLLRDVYAGEASLRDMEAFGDVFGSGFKALASARTLMEGGLEDDSERQRLVDAAVKQGVVGPQTGTTRSADAFAVEVQKLADVVERIEKNVVKNSEAIEGVRKKSIGGLFS